MNQEQILQIFKEYAKDLPDVKLDNFDSFAQQPIDQVITNSLDAVEFALDMEEKLGLEEEELNMMTLMRKFATLTFAELAQELAQYIATAANGGDTSLKNP